MNHPWRNRAPLVRRATLSCLACALIAIAHNAPQVRADWNGNAQIASGLGAITVMAQAPGDPNRLFIGNKDGGVSILDLATGEVRPELFLNLYGEVDVDGEGGLSGLAFHPDYATNGKFYVTVTVDNGGIEISPLNGQPPQVRSPHTAHIREYTVSRDPNRANFTSYRTILEWVKPYSVHTSGWLAFGPSDGMLYVGTGDGGGLYDNAPGHTAGTGNAQDLTDNVMGKILRLDVNGDYFPFDDRRNYALPADNPYVGVPGDDEIFAYGLRNPWRASFDRATGDLWFGDVGEFSREEINVIPTGSGGGQNFGWRVREGANPTPSPYGGSPPPQNTHPIYDYAHLGQGGPPEFSGSSVIGGYIYRGPDPTLQGKYVFGDFVGRKIWMFDPNDPYGTIENISAKITPNANALGGITTFFEDSVGNLYFGTLSGNIFRLETDAWMTGDFDKNAAVDVDDLAVWDKYFGIDNVDSGIGGDADEDYQVAGNDFLLWQHNSGWSALNPAPRPSQQGVPEPAAAMLAALALVCGPHFAKRSRRTQRVPLLPSSVKQAPGQLHQTSQHHPYPSAFRPPACPG